jgi:hypothetical protein
MSLEEASTKELVEELYKRYDEYIFCGIPTVPDGRKPGDDYAFQTTFKAPTIAEAIGLCEFLKASLLRSQMEGATVESSFNRA